MARYKGRKVTTEIPKTDENTSGKFEKNRNEGAVDVLVANKICLRVDFIFKETHVINNCV